MFKSICDYPVPTKFNKLASAAHPKPCGQSATVITLVPYAEALQSRLICLRHSIEIAVYKLAMKTRVVFSDEEKSQLIAVYGSDIEQLWKAENQNNPPNN